MIKNFYSKCFYCGKTTAIMQQKRLYAQENSYLCKECFNKIPLFYRKVAEEQWTQADFCNYVRYMPILEEKRKIFCETSKYKTMLLDSGNGLFMIRNNGKNNDAVFELKNMNRLDITFHPGEIKNLIIAQYIMGSLYLVIDCDMPCVKKEVLIASNISAHIQKNKQTGQNEYVLPIDLTSFYGYVMCALMQAKNMKNTGQYTSSSQYSSQKNAENGKNNDERERNDPAVMAAMSLFMIDSLENMSPELLRAQRNRLMKTFHPDSDGEDEYAKKINEAYALLKQKLAAM